MPYAAALMMLLMTACHSEETRARIEEMDRNGELDGAPRPAPPTDNAAQRQ